MADRYAPAMPTTLSTIQDLIDNQMGMSVHCNVIGCGHSADLDHQGRSALNGLVSVSAEHQVDVCMFRRVMISEVEKGSHDRIKGG